VLHPRRTHFTIIGYDDRATKALALFGRKWYQCQSPYIRSAANVWVDRLNRHFDIDGWQQDGFIRGTRHSLHSIDRFAFALNMLLPRYIACWLDPTCEQVDAPLLPDSLWFCEITRVTSLGPPTLPRTQITLEWSNNYGDRPHMDGQGVSAGTHRDGVVELTVSPRHNLFRQGRRAGRGVLCRHLIGQSLYSAFPCDNGGIRDRGKHAKK
jgi:hypothetical protein